MNQFLFPSLVNGVSVFVGLYILWSLLKFASPGQRAANAAIAGVVSALATFVISALIAGAA